MIRVVFMGTPEFSVNVLDGLVNSKLVDVSLVVSQPDKEVGRKRVLTPSKVSEYASSHALELLKPNNLKEEYEKILEYDPDLIITCAYGKILPKELLAYPRLGAINVHASLLPKYRGGAPIEWSIINGEHETGITVMYMDEAMDSGDIIEQESLEILDSDNKETLTKRLSFLGRDLLLKTLPSIIDQTNKRISQDTSLVTYAYNIKRSDEHLNFDMSSREVFNHVRALSPNPGCYVKIGSKTMKIFEGYISSDSSLGEASEVSKIYKDGIGVNTRDKIYVITKLQMEGKKVCSAKDYINGKSDLLGVKYE